MNQTNKKIFNTYFFFALICIFNLIVFWPSLKHIPRSDQIAYLSTVADQTNFSSLVLKNMDLNRGTYISSGDTWLFRPFLYALLGTERFLFGYSFHLWQLVGIGFHLIFLWVLWRLLTSIKESWLALLFTAMFSVMPVNLDLVIWTNINGYLVSLIFVFLAIRNCFLFVRQHITLKKMIVTNSVMLTMACLFCEFSVFIILGLILYLWATWPQNREGKKWLVMLFVPILVFMAFNGINWFANYYSSLSSQQGYAIKGKFLTKGLGNIPCVFLRWLNLGIFPFQNQFCFLAERFSFKIITQFNPLTILNIILIIKGFLVLKKSRTLMKGETGLKNLFFLFISLILLLCFLFSIFRVGPRSLSYLKQTLYWAYFYWAFMMTAIYILIAHDQINPFPNWSLSNKIIAINCLILTLCYGWIDYGILQKRAVFDQPSARLIAHIEQSRHNSTYDSLDFSQLLTDPGNRDYKYFGDQTLIELLYPSAF